jgi:ATP-dependent Zn protease
MAKDTTTAYHEAGHAVVAFFMRHRIEFATIKPTAEYQGLVKSKPRGKLDLDSATPAMRIKLEDVLIMLLAGDIAQRRFAPRSSRNWQTTEDRQTAADLALSICGTGESATAYIAWLTIRARDIVHGRWSLVERVANALLERETISGEDIRTLILPPNPTRTITVFG